MKKYRNYLIIMLFILIILLLSPICGDDWGNYLEGIQGIKHSFGNAIGMYFDWEGRFISRILINLLTCHKVAWSLINSFLITSIIYLIVKIINPKKRKTIFGLSILAILLMNIYTFSQVITWIAGNITYLFVIPLLLYYFYSVIENKTTQKKFLLFCFLNIIMTMFVENMAVVLVFGNLLLLISKLIKTKKVDKELLTYLIISVISLLSMILSPGSMKRSSIENTTFNSLNIIQKVLYNMPNFIYYTFIINTYLVLIGTIANYYLIKNTVKIKILKVAGYLYLLIVPLLSTGLYLLSNFINIDTYQNNSLLIIYFTSYIIIDFIMIYLDTKTDNKKRILFFYLLGLISNLVMLISPTWGFRTSFGTYIFLTITYLFIIDKNLIKTKILNYCIIALITIGSCFYLILYISVYRQYQVNYKSIKQQLKENKETIKIVKYPYFINCNINPENEYHITKFKKYYKIDESKQIELIDNNWKYIIFYSK